MKDDERERMIGAAASAWDWLDVGDEHYVAAYLDALTRAGFSITHDAIRDHSANCLCEGTGVLPESIPCRGGVLVPWEASDA